MRFRPLRSLIALAVACSLLAACSSASGPETAEGDKRRVGADESPPTTGKRANKKKGNQGRKGPGRVAAGQPGAETLSPGESPPPAKGGTTAAPQSFASQGPPSPRDPSLARRSSTIDDPPDDSQKEGALVPPYSELVRAAFRGLGEDFEVRLSFNGSVPETMPDDKTVMVIGVGISCGGNDTYGFTAQATPDGWKAHAGAKDGARKFPGEFRIENGEIVMSVPWRFIKGPRAFRWQVNSTWFKSVANTSHYAFDMAPNEQSAEFPD